MTTESPLEYETRRLRDRTRHNEASALGHAKREAIAELSKLLLDAGVSEDTLEEVIKKYKGQ
jgi:hypothetical protein